MMQTKRRENLSGEVQYFAGLVRCADCDSALNVSYNYNRKRYKSMSEVYSSELSEFTERCKQISSALSKSDEIEDNISSFLPIIRKYTDLHELNARILNELIEKIVVHEKEKAEDGTVTQQVDIYYKFIGLTISEKADINMLG